MFEEILGIPAHPLLIHAAVVFIPLQIAAALAYAFLPWARRHAEWFVAGLILVAPGSALLAKLSGDAFRARLVRNGTKSVDLLNRIDTHRSLGTTTVYLTAGLSILMIIMLLVRRAAVAAPDGPASMAGRGDSLLVGRGAVSLVLALAVVAVAVVTGYYVFRTGDTGAHIVWTGM